MDITIHRTAEKYGTEDSSGNLKGGDSELPLTCQGNTSLHIAVKHRNTTTRKTTTERILNSYPSLVHETNVKGDTPLHIAARLGYVDVAELLTQFVRNQGEAESGTLPLRALNVKQNTALHEAVQNGHYDVVDLLIKEDQVLTSIRNDSGEPPLFMAVDRGFYGIAIRILETFPTCSCLGRSGMNVMHAAVICVHDKFVKMVLTKCGPQILEEKDDFEWIPLHYAAYVGNSKVVELFLEKNSSLAYIKDKQGMSAIHICAREGHIGVIKTLLKICPDVGELLDNNNQTALHVAVKSGKNCVVWSLLRKMAFDDLVNEQDKQGNTSLHLAAHYGYIEILTMLVNNTRTDKGAINHLGMTATDIIQSSTQLSEYEKHFIIVRLNRKGGKPSLERRVVREFTSIGCISKEDPQPSSGGKIAEEDKGQEGKLNKQFQNVAKVNLLIATIIVSITFAAAIQVPGGYENTNGMPVLRRKATFTRFLLFNSLAFGLSAASLLIHFFLAFFSMLKIATYHFRWVDLLTEFSIIFMVLALREALSAILSETDKINGKTPLPILYAGEYSFTIPTMLVVLGLLHYFPPSIATIYIKLTFRRMVDFLKS